MTFCKPKTATCYFNQYLKAATMYKTHDYSAHIFLSNSAGHIDTFSGSYTAPSDTLILAQSY